MRNRLWFVDACLVAFILLIAMISLESNGVDRFDSDEAHKISETYYFNLFFVQHDINNVAWNEDFYARTNPPVAKYLMGSYLHFKGIRIADQGLQGCFDELWRSPDELRRCIHPETLNAARQVSMFFAAMCCAIVYLLCSRITCRPTGVIAALFLLTHPLFSYHCSLALTDSYLLFFLSAMVLLLITSLLWLRDRGGQVENSIIDRLQEICLLYVAPAVVIFCAAGVKLNGALAGVLWVLMIGGVLVLFLCRGSKVGAGKLVAYTFAAPLAGIILFIVLNPFLYNDALGKLLTTVPVYHEWMLKQVIDPGELIQGWQAKWTEYYLLVFKTGERNLFPFTRQYIFSPLAFLAGTGFCYLVSRLVDSLKRNEPEIRSLVVIVWGIVYSIGILAWISVDWERYYLPLLPLTAVFIACGLQAFWNAGAAIFRKNGLSGRLHLYLSGVSVLILWLLIFLPVDCSLVSPRVLLTWVYPPETLAPYYQKGLAKYATSPTRLLHWAEFQDMTGNAAQAAIDYEKGLYYLTDKSPSLLAMKVSCQNKLYALLIQAGEREKGATVLRKSVSTLELLTGTLKSGDPTVQKAFARLISERTALLNEYKND